jgi:hypothetical protein
MIRKATCCCGKSSIEVEGEPIHNGICHCNDCKKRTGSAFGWSAYFTDGQILQKAGDLRAYEISGEKAQQRWFCANCGSTLFWKVTFFLPNCIGIAGGCFADNPLDPPGFSGNNEGRCVWLDLPAGCVIVDDRNRPALIQRLTQLASR